MSDEEQIEENIRKYIKGHSTTIKAYTQEYVDKKDKEIKILKSRLEEYQEYVEINHKEIERLNNIIKEQGLEDKPNYYVKGLEGSLKEYQEEIERLKNIINELEHHLYQEWLEWKDSDCESIYSRAGEDKAIYDYIQELKGSDKE